MKRSRAASREIFSVAPVLVPPPAAAPPAAAAGERRNARRVSIEPGRYAQKRWKRARSDSRAS
jgi:hypothetical protein